MAMSEEDKLMRERHERLCEIVKTALTTFSSPTRDPGDSHGARGQAGWIVWEGSIDYIAAEIARESEGGRTVEVEIARLREQIEYYKTNNREVGNRINGEVTRLGELLAKAREALQSTRIFVAAEIFRREQDIPDKLIDKLLAMEACAANEESETLTKAIDALHALIEAVRYADTHIAVSRAAYPHACIEYRKFRDLIDAALTRI